MVLSPAELADVSSINFSCSARLELIGFEQIKKMEISAAVER